LPDWVISFNDAFVEFVRFGPVALHLAVFVPLGALVGAFAARWSAHLIGRESERTRQLSRGWWWTIVAATAGLYGALVVAVSQGGCQAVPEGGSIDWVHWRLLHHYALILFLVVATAIDFDQYLIPDEITMIGTAVGIAGAVACGNMQLMHLWINWNAADPIYGPYIPEWIKDHWHWHGLAWSLTGMIVGAGVTWTVRAVSRKVLGVEALGFGDVTLMGMIGSFLGWQPILFIFLLAPMCGVVIGMANKLLHGRRAIPYGPYLAFATVIVLFTWKWLWTPTRDLFGHWPTLVGLAALVTISLAAMLGLIRLYRAIPVKRRDDTGERPGAGNVRQSDDSTVE
jgi:leader peptidase (prepilin peptidase)/N-methyltransferase